MRWTAVIALVLGLLILPAAAGAHMRRATAERLAIRYGDRLVKYHVINDFALEGCTFLNDYPADTPGAERGMYACTLIYTFDDDNIADAGCVGAAYRDRLGRDRWSGCDHPASGYN